MTGPKLRQVSGLALLVGGVAFTVHIALRSLITAGLPPTAFATHGLWVPINALGLIGAVLVLLGLPAVYPRMAAPTDRLGLVGIALVAVAWMFFGLFLSLYAVLLLPWLAAKAPALVATDAPLPGGFIVAFSVALTAWFMGTVLLAVPFVRGRAQPRWVGYVLLASAPWMVVGSLVIAPSGPATNLAVNLISNLGPVLLLVALGRLGLRIWVDNGQPRSPGMHQASHCGNGCGADVLEQCHPRKPPNNGLQQTPPSRSLGRRS